MISRRLLTIACAATLLVSTSACGPDNSEPSLSGVPITEDTGNVGSIPAEQVEVDAGQPFPAQRCQANRDAGPIVYLSSFDFAASASIIDVLVAAERGYYADLCLDVEVRPGTNVTANYPLIAANEAQFASGGSFGELVDFAGRNDAGFVALSIEGRTGIDALITRPGAISELSEIKDQTIGIKGALPASIKAMLLTAGLTDGIDYDTVMLEGLDPTVHIAQPDIVGFPGYRSNEPLQLEAAGIPFDEYDPSDYGIPGSFGVIYSNQTFLAAHPTAVEDFMRATMHGLADALADPQAAAKIAIERINENGNTMFLSPAGEIARWHLESAIVASGTSAQAPPGVPQPDLLEREINSYGEIGVFDGLVPDFHLYVDLDLVRGVYDDAGAVIWPSV